MRMRCCYFVKFEYCVLFFPFLCDSVMRWNRFTHHILATMYKTRERERVETFPWLGCCEILSLNQKEKRKRKIRNRRSRNSLAASFHRNTRNAGWFICERTMFTYYIHIFDVFSLESVLLPHPPAAAAIVVHDFWVQMFHILRSDKSWQRSRSHSYHIISYNCIEFEHC